MVLPSYSLYYVNPDGSVVAQTLTGLSYTTTPGKCYVTSAVRATTVLTVGLNGETYTMTFKCDHRIRTVGYIMFLFPIE